MKYQTQQQEAVVISLEPEIQFSNSQGIHVKHGISIIHHKIWRMHRIATEDSIVL